MILPGDPSPQAIILARNTLSFSPSGFEGTHVCGITVKFWGEPLVLVSVYIHHTSAEGTGALANAVRKARTISPFIYVGMDSNGHSPLWGPASTMVDHVGEAIESVLCKGGVMGSE